MTIRDLNQLFYLNREIQREKHRLNELEAVATGTSAKITGLPHVGMISDKTALAAEIVDAQAVIEAKIALSVMEYNRLNRYINQIPDGLTRQIFALRFVNGLSYHQIAASVGGGNSYESIKKRIFRQIKKTCP